MDIKVILTSVVSSVAVVVLAFLAFPTETPTFVGSSVGPQHTEPQYFDGGATYGSGCFATTTTGTLTAGDLDNGCIDIAPAGAGQATLSLTLPSAAAVTSRHLPKVGSCRDWSIDASDVAAATTTTFVAGANMDLVGLDATGAGTGADVIDGAEYARLTLCHQAGNRVTGYITEWINAD